MKRFYVAASIRRREQAREVRDRLLAANAGWECSAGWLAWTAQPSTGRAAWLDKEDVCASDLLVWLGGPPSSEGKHVELGMALASGIPVVAVRSGWWPGADTEEEGRWSERSIFHELCAGPGTLEELLEEGLDAARDRCWRATSRKAEAHREEPAVEWGKDGGGETGATGTSEERMGLKEMVEVVLGRPMEQALEDGLDGLIEAVQRKTGEGADSVAQAMEQRVRDRVQATAKARREVEAIRQSIASWREHRARLEAAGEGELAGWVGDEVPRKTQAMDAASARASECAKEEEAARSQSRKVAWIAKRVRDRLGAIKNGASGDPR